MAFAFSTLLLLVAWLAVYSHGFPVLDQPIYEAPGLPKVDIYYQGGVTSHFDKQLAPLPFVSGSKNSFKKSGDDYRMIGSNEIHTGFEGDRTANEQGVAFAKSLKVWTAPELDSVKEPRQTPRAFDSWRVTDREFQQS